MKAGEVISNLLQVRGRLISTPIGSEPERAIMRSFIQTVDLVLDNAFPCSNCRGRGFTIKEKRPTTGYTTIALNNGKVVFKVNCQKCNGDGQDLNKRCEGCGEPYDSEAYGPFLSEKELELCDPCREFHLKTFGPKPECMDAIYKKPERMEIGLLLEDKDETESIPEEVEQKEKKKSKKGRRRKKNK